MAEVRLERIARDFGSGRPAVDDVSLTVADREFLVLVGPSGCGKSTTLRMIAGLEQPTSGDIFIDGRRVNDVPPRDRDIAMVFQNYALYPHMTVYRNLAFGLILRRFPKDEIDRRVREAAATLGIADLLDRKPRALSGGQRQRVALGRAMVRRPSVFLFDEPLSNLDAKMRVTMRAEIGRLHRRLATTMIYVTHDQVEAMTMGDRIVVMNEGRVQQIDTPMGLYERPANRFVAGFIGSPAMNFIDGRLVADGDALFFEAGPLRLRLPDEHCRRIESARTGDGPVTLGIRPEHFALAGGDSAPGGGEHRAADGDLFSTDGKPAGVGSRLRGDDAGDERQLLRAVADTVEPLGADLYVHFELNGAVLTARLDGRAPVRPGDPVHLRVDLRRAHWFAPSGPNLVAME